NDRARDFGDDLIDGWVAFRPLRRGDAAELLMSLNQKHDAFAQIIRSRTRLPEQGVALVGRGLERGQKEFAQPVGFGGHGEPRGLQHSMRNWKAKRPENPTVNRSSRATGP